MRFEVCQQLESYPNFKGSDKEHRLQEITISACKKIEKITEDVVDNALNKRYIDVLSRIESLSTFSDDLLERERKIRERHSENPEDTNKKEIN